MNGFNIAPASHHGHDVLDLVAANPNGIAKTALAASFAPGARFHTCSADGMSFDELLAFLDARDKIRIDDGMVHPGSAPACDH